VVDDKRRGRGFVSVRVTEGNVLAGCGSGRFFSTTLWSVTFLQHCTVCQWLQNRSSVLQQQLEEQAATGQQLAWLRLAPRGSRHLHSAHWQLRIDVSEHLQLLKMGPTGCAEMSEPNYQSALCKIPEERNLWCRSGESNKLQKDKNKSWRDKECNYWCSACCIYNRRISAVVVVLSAHQVVPHDVPSDVTAHRVINTLYCVCERISGWLPSCNRLPM